MIDFLEIALTKTIVYSFLVAFVLWGFLGFMQIIIKKPILLRYLKLATIITYTLGLFSFFMYQIVQGQFIHNNFEHVDIASFQTETSFFDIFLQVDQWIISYSTLISVIWFIGFLYTSFQLIKSFKEVSRYRQSSIVCNEERINGLLNLLKTKLGIKRIVEIRISSLLNSPMTTGIVKPIIYLPVGLISGYNFDEIDIILNHELAHIKRHDYLINVFLNITEVLFFYNPIVIHIIQDLRLDMEMVCDDEVLKHHNKANYARTLLKLQELQCDNPLPLAAVKQNNSAFRKRMERIILNNKPRKSSGILIFVTLISASLMSLSFIQNNDFDEYQNESTIIRSTPKLNISDDEKKEEIVLSNSKNNAVELVQNKLPKIGSKNNKIKTVVAKKSSNPLIERIHKELIKDKFLSSQNPKITLLFQYSDILNGKTQLGDKYEKYKAIFNSEFPDYDSFATTQVFRYKN